MQHRSLKIKTLGYQADHLPQPGGNYVSVRLSASLAYVAIQFPIVAGKFMYQGKLGAELNTDEGYAAARLCAMNALYQLEKYVGLDQLISINHMDFFYQPAHAWDDAPIVANGASDLFVEVLQEAGLHSRAILGVAQLPRNFAVGLTVVATLS